MAIDKITTPAIADDAVTNAKVSYNNNQFRNIIINGDMSIAQRATSVTGIQSSGYRTVDRFKQTFSGSLVGTWTQSQSTDVPTGQGFSTSLKLDCTTADASLAANESLKIQQRFEGQNLQYLKKGTSSAESLTLSFWVKSAKTGTYICELVDNDNGRQISKSYTISSANTWEKKTITYPGDTTGALDNDNAQSLVLNWWLVAGSNFSSGTLSTTWTSTTDANRAVGNVDLADSTDNDWYVTGVQLEAGTSASDFEFLPVDVNLERCQRYLQFIDAEYFVVPRFNNGTGKPLGQLTFPKTMRASPTGTATGTFLSSTGYAGTPSFYNIQPVCLALEGANSIAANVVEYLHGGIFKMEAEL